MEKFAFVFQNQNVLSLYTDSNKVIKKIFNDERSVKKTIPIDIQYIGSNDKIEEDQNYILFMDGNEPAVSVDINNNISWLSLPEKDLFFPDLVYLAIGMMANYFQKEQKYFVQSSVVKYDDDKSIMLIGDPNAGKTTLASKLVLNGNWSLVSNDNVLVGHEDDKFKTYAGTKMVQMRYGAIQLFFPELLTKVDEPTELDKRDVWDIKVYVDEIFKKYDVKYDNLSSISDIYIINTMKNANIFVREKEPIDKLLLIYEHLTKQIRSNRYALTSFNYPLPSFETQKGNQERYELASKIAKNVGLFEMKGDVDEIVMQLRKKYEK